MKYLVIKDCPGFKVGDVVESFKDSLKRELICRAPEFPVYLPDKTTEYFKPMWFNFGDKIRRKDWKKGDYFIPGSYNHLTNSFMSKSKYGSCRYSNCLNQDEWEFHKEPEEKIMNENDFKCFFELCARNEPTLLLNLLGSSWMEDIYKSFKARLIEELNVSGVIWDGSKLFDGKLCDNNQAAD